MNSADQIRIAAEHLANAMIALEKLGADLTAAKLSSAMDSFRSEIRSIPLCDASVNDFNELDAAVLRIFTDDSFGRERIPT